MGLNASWPDGLPPVKPAAFGRGVQNSRIEERESQTQRRGHRADVRNELISAGRHIRGCDQKSSRRIQLRSVYYKCRRA
jgi:hypothetical protein